MRNPIRYQGQQKWLDRILPKIGQWRDESVGRYNLPRLNQEEIKIINRSITTVETETVINNCPINKSPGPNGPFIQILRKELTPTLLKLFQKLQRKEDS